MCNQAIETFEDSGFVAEIHYDHFAGNPREEEDNLGHIVAWHGRYDLGDKDQKKFKTRGPWLAHLLDEANALETLIAPEDYISVATDSFDKDSFVYDLENDDDDCMVAAFKALEGLALIVPIYLYDHGNIALRCAPFADPWDSGQVGYIYMTADKIRHEYGKDAAAWDKAKKYLIGEVEDYSLYVSGQCYVVFIKDEDDETLDFCGGYLGMESAAEEAKSNLKYYAGKGREAAAAAEGYGYA